ncbi:methyltransferase-like protein 27 [Haliotis rufescens]|uniref:methyltransferase-like protein 27 n=1 Tax=Haliotis rufescens TaxID=6454 RepID=UPI001EB039D3|nr:methyltransferase-like protein 27 [Haliotis rufescens]
MCTHQPDTRTPVAKMSERTYSEEEVKEAKREFNSLIEKGLDNETVVKRFDHMSDKYDMVLGMMDYKMPKWMGDSLASLYPGSKEKINILDVAAGTGLASVQMRKHGFLHIDGLDPSEGMLEQAKKNNLYERYICDILADNTLDISDDTYTVVTVVGLSSEFFKKLPVKALEELARVTKSGGHILMSHFDYIFESDVLRTNLLSLGNRGLWKLEDKKIMPEIVKGITGHLHIYKVL